MRNNKKHSIKTFFSITILFLAATLFISSGMAIASNKGVQVKKGWTPIPGGEANSENDITMKNSNFALTISGTDGTKPPWGVPRGGILDGAPVVNGEIKLDRLIIVDFLPDRWAAWPTTYQEVEIVENTKEKGVVEVRRDYDNAELITTITLKKNDDFAHLKTKLKNGETAYKNLNSGYTLSIEGGWIDVPGGRGSRKDTLGDWMVGYNEDWAFGLHSQFHNKVKGGTTWTEQFVTNDIKSKEEKTYETWLQVVSSGESSSIIDFNMNLTNTEGGSITGEVLNTSGEKIENPIVVAYKDGQVIGWTIGEKSKYSFNLPAGTYQLKAMAEKNAPSSSKKVTITENKETKVNLTDVKAPGKLDINITEKDTGKALDARLEFSGGPKYPINYLGSNTKFTDLENKGKANFVFPPSSYDVSLSSGANFISEKTTLEEVEVESGKKTELNAEIDIITDPNDKNWYSADLHQHSNILDGITEPKELIVSNLAAQLDLALVSDHDAVATHEKIKEYADSRNLPFIPSIEISPMWSHFNIYPVPLGSEKLNDVGSGNASEIFKAARELGDVVIQVNHPWIAYGYYNAKNNAKIPGEYNEDYDVVEIRKEKIKESDKKTLEKMYSLWNKGKEKYMVGNTDIHDVQSNVTGYIRTFAQVEGELNRSKYIKAVKEGNSFVSRGPLVYPENINFGETYEAENGIFNLSFTAEAVNDLKEIYVVSEGEKVRSRVLSSDYVDLESKKSESFDFYLSPSENTWYSIIIIDKKGNHLYSNPIWVKNN